jgi:hypothetical protein
LFLAQHPSSVVYLSSLKLAKVLGIFSVKNPLKTQPKSVQ